MRKPTQTRRGHPTGFTLIELLVVIAILAVLFSLTSAAVMKVIDAGRRTEIATDIRNLEQSMRAAMSEMGGVDYIPSRLLLKSVYAAGATGEEGDSLKYLQKLFGAKAVQAGQTYKWGPGGTALPAAGVRLTGPEVLVFVLGGMVDTSGGTPTPVGFSRTSNPAALPATPGEKRYGPYFDFKPTRLQKNTNNSGFLFYLDPVGSPYLFFSRAPDGLETYDSQLNLYYPSGLGSFPKPTVSPYMSDTKQYMSPKWCQIISAGKNKQFGPGGTAWSAQNGYAGNNPAGNDDMSNFQTAPLAIGSN